MAERDFFEKALSNFTYEAASGGVIRHLADRGYTVQQIVEKLDFPTPYERVQEVAWAHMTENGCILPEEPGHGSAREKVEYVTEYDSYGKKSFRRVVIKENVVSGGEWKERLWGDLGYGKLAELLAEKCRENGENSAYISCNFGVRLQTDPDIFAEELSCLVQKQKEYILGLPWEAKVVYHRLDQRMREIVSCLFEHGLYHGNCYFIKLNEKIKI